MWTLKSVFGAFVLGLCRHVGAVVDIRACTETVLSKVNKHLKNTPKFYTAWLIFIKKIKLGETFFYGIYLSWLIDGC